MQFTEKLPELHELCAIAKAIQHYPATAEEVRNTAKSLGCKKNVLRFIDLLCDKTTAAFESRIDFYTRAAGFALLLCEERIQPQEKLLSLQS